MKSLMFLVILMLAFINPVLAHYTPPNNGGPGSSRGSGTRIWYPDSFEVVIP